MSCALCKAVQGVSWYHVRLHFFGACVKVCGLFRLCLDTVRVSATDDHGPKNLAFLAFSVEFFGGLALIQKKIFHKLYRIFSRAFVSFAQNYIEHN